MATAESPSTQALPGDSDEGGGRDPRIEIPTVAAVVVTRNPGAWLEQALQSVGNQDYPSVAVLVVDAASEEDPSERIAGALPDAFVRRVPRPGFAAAANEALHTVRNATFLLICHDDVVLDPAAVRLMLGEAFRSNAGIVGPKIVDADDPEVLLEVGRSIDPFGNPHTGIEPGELDQEQHDGVRDVFYVSDTAMLVRTDLFHELGGFDVSRFPAA
jgi:GT2 family glycosyltransferase